MDENQNVMENFRVPKKKNKEKLELLPLASEEREFLISKISDSFKKPEISKSSMKFLNCWQINNSEAEVSYSKKRISMRSNSINSSESFGFLFIKSETDLRNIVTVGRIEIGNLLESCLGTPSMGVSLCQHADIYHPNVPKTGIILVVKYIKGKVHYLPYDLNPLDPQPNFNCHAIRSSIINDYNTNISVAFHSTQIFLYEYSDDFDIQRFPSQLLILGAVQFKWAGLYIYKEIQQNDSFAVQSAKFNSKRFNLSQNEIASKKPVQMSFSNTIPQKSPIQLNLTETGIMSTMIIGTQLPAPSLTVKLLSRLKEPVMIRCFMTQNWNLVELIPYKILEDYFCYMDNRGVVRYLHLIYNEINVLPDRFDDGKKIMGTFHPKYALHFSMLPDNFRDIDMISKTIKSLESLKMVGLVRCNALENFLFYIFPSGHLSKVLGLSAIDSVNTLHVILLCEQHPSYLGCSNFPKDKIEQKNFHSLLQDYEKSSIKTVTNQPPISLTVLKNIAFAHGRIQKEFTDKHVQLSHKLSATSLGICSDDSDMEIDSNHEENNESNNKHLEYSSTNHLYNPVHQNSSNYLSAEITYLPHGHQRPQINHVSPFSLTNHHTQILPNRFSIPPPNITFNSRPIYNGFNRDPHRSQLTKYPPLQSITNDNSNQTVVSPNTPNNLPSILKVSLPPNQTDDVQSLSKTYNENITQEIDKHPVRQSFGYFKLMQFPYNKMMRKQQKCRPRTYYLGKEFCSRRPVFLDPGIFKKTEEFSHISVYRG